jgi:hypothetical protein
MKDDEIGGACNTDGRDEKRLQNFGRKDIGIDGKITVEWISRKVWTECIWLRRGASGGVLQTQY